jgi:hypothetical protein
MEERVDNIEWKEFTIKELFIIDSGSGPTKGNIIDGGTPYVSHSNLKNGVIEYIDIKGYKTFTNALTINKFGESFYHSYEFGVYSGVLVLKLKEKELNDSVGLFLSVSLSKLSPKYSYSKVLGKEILQNERIWLPINENSEPDYEFMVRYIKSLNFSEILG